MALLDAFWPYCVGLFYGLFWLGCCWALIYQWRRGIYITRFGQGTREDDPHIFWFWIIFWIVLVAGLTFVGLALLLPALALNRGG